MRFRFLLALVALTFATYAEAGPRRYYQPVYQSPYVAPAGYYAPAQSYVMPAGYTYPVSPAPYTAQYTPAVMPAAATVPAPGTTPDLAAFGSGDGLEEVNAKRAARGLRPFLRDPGLTQAAHACAAFRAERGLFGHTTNDFAFVPAGSSAASAGCAAYPASYGWMSCCVYENYTYAGAAWVTGRDGKRYMHLFVR